jgi:hypothetical protein
MHGSADDSAFLDECCRTPAHIHLILALKGPGLRAYVSFAATLNDSARPVD